MERILSRVYKPLFIALTSQNDFDFKLKESDINDFIDMIEHAKENYGGNGANYHLILEKTKKFAQELKIYLV